ncbi:Cyclic AMP receptor-like protein A [Holothuria leucospilota]|uniref:Cyclic AMP receptor-like protein A n=1 Tax=Holothuria leucospilota TaxID=206669 RepID=A0A9Q1H4D5_HOLLE|nr:Cyclic AMP receptor-like protein A [Holothuria leucospilota]
MSGSASDVIGAFCRDIFLDNQCTALRVTQIVFAIIAVSCSIFLIFVLWLFNKLKIFFYRILLFIALCNILQTIAVLIPVDNDRRRSPGCTFQGLLLQFSTCTTVSWELGLTAHLFAKTFYSDQNDYDRIYHAACWGVPALLTIIPLIAKQYGPAIIWCWIVDPNWQFAMFYAEYIFVFILVFALYARIVYKILSEKPKTAEDVRRLAQWRKKVRPMILYPCVIILEGIIPLSFRFKSLIRPDDDISFAFTLIFAIIVNFWGVAFVAVYTMDPVTRYELLLIPVRQTKCRERWVNRGIQSGLPAPHPLSSSPAADDRRKTQNDAGSVSSVSIDPSTDGDGKDNQAVSMETSGKDDVNTEIDGTDSNENPGIHSSLPAPHPETSSSTAAEDRGRTQNDAGSVSSVSIDPSTDGDGKDNQAVSMETSGKDDVNTEIDGTDSNENPGIHSSLPAPHPETSSSTAAEDRGRTQNDAGSVSSVSIDPSTDGGGKDNQAVSMETCGKDYVNTEIAGTDSND